MNIIGKLDFLNDLVCTLNREIRLGMHSKEISEFSVTLDKM